MTLRVGDNQLGPQRQSWGGEFAALTVERAARQLIVHALLTHNSCANRISFTSLISSLPFIYLEHLHPSRWVHCVSQLLYNIIVYDSVYHNKKQIQMDMSCSETHGFPPSRHFVLFTNDKYCYLQNGLTTYIGILNNVATRDVFKQIYNIFQRLFSKFWS